MFLPDPSGPGPQIGLPFRLLLPLLRLFGEFLSLLFLAHAHTCVVACLGKALLPLLLDLLFIELGTKEGPTDRTEYGVWEIVSVP